MGQFRLSPLRGDGILQAYPLVCAAAGNISIDDWRVFVDSMLSGKSRNSCRCDIVGACSSNGYLRGLFTYRVTPDLHYGRTLDVEYFVVESIYSPRVIFAALMRGADDEARRHGCRAIHAQMPPGSGWLSKMFMDHDYTSDANLWCKRSD